MDERQISEIPINLFPWERESTGRPIDLGWMEMMLIQMTRINDDPDDLDGSDLKALKKKNANPNMSKKVMLYL